ncbi:MAG TPA: right-handed parallel beta-helix repeat-containing protein [Candidatus Limnocylindrales bacterium]|nr:right-handed parallel beta-helix repeat-containing protein [Candidatus Limnocylindrales bacterium]
MRPRALAAVTPVRLVALALALAGGLVLLAIAGAHLGFGPLHGATSLHELLSGGRGNIAFIGSSIPGNPTGDPEAAYGRAAGYGGDEAGADTGAPEERVVSALDDFFDPQVLRVQPGTTVEFANDGRNPHTVTADDGTYDSGVIQGGGSFSHTYTTPGIYPFNCKLHGAAGGIGMSGIVAVGDVALPTNGGHGGVGPGREPVPAAPGATIHVPADRPTIQAGVDAASPGDLVLVAPGTYPESVLVRTPYLTIRGEDRNGVILDGEQKRANGIHVVEADGVVLENLTAHGYQLNGFYWSGVDGYRGSYLTAYGNGDYGVYAFDSRYGRFEHSYASGHPDSGFYIGQCYPCDAVIDDVRSVHNALGYSGTNAGGNLAIVNSEWTDNLAGIAPNTLDSERLAPQREAYLAGNWIHANDATDAPTKRLEYPTYGIGVVLAGGRGNVVEGNLIEDNPTYGVGVLPNLDDNLWLTHDNVVRGNVVRDSGRADLALGMPATGSDCFADNAFTTSQPPAIEAFAGCAFPLGAGGDGAPTFNLLGRFAQALGGDYPSGRWEDEPAPPAQPSMPDAAAPPVLAIPETAVPGPYAVRSIAELEAASAAAGPGPTTPREVMILGIPLTSGLTTLLGVYGYILPLVLYASWVAISLWDLVRRDELSDGRRLGWMTVVLLVPFLGPPIYLLAGGSPIARSMRLFLVFGALAIYLVIAMLSFLLQAL